MSRTIESSQKCMPGFIYTVWHCSICKAPSFCCHHCWCGIKWPKIHAYIQGGRGEQESAVIICQLLTTIYTRESKLLWHLLVYITVLAPHSACCCMIISQCPSCSTYMPITVSTLQVLQTLEYFWCQLVALLAISEGCI